MAGRAFTDASTAGRAHRRVGGLCRRRRVRSRFQPGPILRPARPSAPTRLVVGFPGVRSGIRASLHLGRICADFGIEADFDDPQPLDALPRPDVSSCVLFVTDSDGPSKCWPAERWAALAADIRELGLDTRVVTRDGVEPELAALEIESVVAPTPGDAVDVLTAARAVIGIDTGLTHIAVQQGTPTVTIARASTVFFRPWPHARVIFGDRCDDRCTALEEEYAYNERVDLRGFRWQPRACPVGGRCLDPVRPAHVFDALEQVL
ncbi:MAG: glycosyltransferase family 9 protein [Actinobacteria bacterium]|nr:MAG: glycosyltransferase family 9 protein [Actinomycetota bacterium]